MKAPIASTLTLEVVAQHFAQWRSHKQKGERIPEHLWREAISLLDVYPISQVTRTLRLSGSDVNKRRGITRVTRRQKGMGAKDTPDAAFVEIDRRDVAQATGLNAAAPWLERPAPSRFSAPAWMSSFQRRTRISRERSSPGESWSRSIPREVPRALPIFPSETASSTSGER